MRRSLLLMISRPWFLEDRGPKVTVEISARAVGFSERKGRGARAGRDESGNAPTRSCGGGAKQFAQEDEEAVEGGMEEACFIVAAQARWYQSVKQGSRWTSPVASKKPAGKYVAAAPRRRRRKGKPATSEAAASNSPWPRLCLSFALSHSVSSRAAATAARLHFRSRTRF